MQASVRHHLNDSPRAEVAAAPKSKGLRDVAVVLLAPARPPLFPFDACPRELIQYGAPGAIPGEAETERRSAESLRAGVTAARSVLGGETEVRPLGPQLDHRDLCLQPLLQRGSGGRPVAASRGAC